MSTTKYRAIVAGYKNEDKINQIYNDSNKKMLLTEGHFYRFDKPRIVEQLKPSSTSQFVWDLPREGQAVYQNIVLMMTYSAITHNGVGTFARFCDAAGFFALDRIEIKFASKTILDVKAQEMYTRFIQDFKDADYNMHANDLGVGWSTTTRQNAAQQNQTFVIPLDMITPLFERGIFWRPLLNYQEPLQLIVYVKPYNDFIEHDYTSVSVDVDMKLSITYNYPTPTILKDAIAWANKGEGIPYHGINVRKFEKDLTNATEFEIDISAIKNSDVISMDIIFQQPATQSDKRYTTFDNILKEYWLESNGSKIHGSQDVFTVDFYKKVLLEEYNPANLENMLNSNLTTLCWSKNLEASYGHDHYYWFGSRWFMEDDIRFRSTLKNAYTGRCTLLIYRFQPVFLQGNILKSDFGV